MTTEHLTSEQVSRYRNNDLLDEEIADVYTHLDHCDSCRSSIETAETLQPVFAGLRADLFTGGAQDPDHPDADTQAAYIEGSLAGIERQILESHIETCTLCVDEIRRLRAFRAMLSTYPTEMEKPYTAPTMFERVRATLKIPAVRFSVQTLGAATLALMLFFLLDRRHGGGVSDGAGSRVAELSAELRAARQSALDARGEADRLKSDSDLKQREFASLRADLQRQLAAARGSGNRVESPGLKSVAANLYRDSKGQVMMALPSADSSAALVALQDGKLKMPAGIAELNSHGALLGNGDDQAVQPLEPAGTYIATERPTFRWQSVAGAKHYLLHLQTPPPDRRFIADIRIDRIDSAGSRWKATLLDSTGAQVGKPQIQTAGNSWMNAFAKTLTVSGQAYQWTVKSYGDDASSETIQALPVIPEKFQVLTAIQQSEVKKARAMYADSHLLLGIVLTRFGLIQDARTELELQLKQTPMNGQVKALLKQITFDKIPR